MNNKNKFAAYLCMGVIPSLMLMLLIGIDNALTFMISMTPLVLALICLM